MEENNKDNIFKPVIIVLSVIAILLGVYIGYKEISSKDLKPVEDNTPIEEDNGSEVEEPEEEQDPYASLLIEDGNKVYDYDIINTQKGFDYKKAYDLVIKESSKLAKKKNINLFNYYGRVDLIGGKYYYANYDVYFYNLPKDVYNENADQIEEDKKNKNDNCFDKNCKVEVSEEYKNISKYLVKTPFYYYVFDGDKKVETRDIFNKNLIINNIPNDWLKLGNYKTKEAMYKDILLMNSERHEYKNYLVIYDTGTILKIKYKGKSKIILDADSYESRINDYYDKDAEVPLYNKSYIGSYSAFVYHDKLNNTDETYKLYLRADGTYFLNLNTEAGEGSVGKYEVNNNKIILVDEVYYSSHVCYYTNSEELEKWELSINSNGSLDLKYNKKTYTFKKISDEPYDTNYEWYTLNPKDGESPKGYGEEWMKCD